VATACSLCERIHGRDIGRVARDSVRSCPGKVRSACDFSSREIAVQECFAASVSPVMASILVYLAAGRAVPLLSAVIIISRCRRPDRRLACSSDRRRSRASRWASFFVGIVVSNALVISQQTARSRLRSGLSLLRAVASADSNEFLRRSWISSHGDRHEGTEANVPLGARRVVAC